MFGHHWKLALRNLFKKKGHALLNLLGLGIAIACCLLIFQYVAYERSFDSYPSGADRIVRLRLDSYQQGQLAWQSATVYPAIGPNLKKDFPEVLRFCRIYDADLLLSNEEKNVRFREPKGYYADPAFLSMFRVEFLRGDPNRVLDAPYRIVLSETAAKKYFGNEDPIGKRLAVDANPADNLEVTGVFRDYPANSHLILNHLVSYSTMAAEQLRQGDSSNATETSFGWYDFYTYLELRPGTDWKKLEARLPAFADKYINSREWNKQHEVRACLHLIPLRDIHLYSNANQEAEVNGDGKAVGFLYLVAFLIVAIAWVNYSNLATARSLERAREVGVRKVVGALRRDLVAQFLLESLLLNLMALVIAILAAWLLVRPFNELIGSQAGAQLRLPWTYALGFLAIFVTGSFLSGLYPAVILSGYRPVTVLKGLFKNSVKGQVMRKSLIIGQFATSVVLIAGTLTIYLQVRYMQNQELGVSIKQTLVLQGAATPNDSLYGLAFQPFKAELLGQRGIQSVTASSNVMGQEIYWTNGVSRADPRYHFESTLYILGIDYDFLDAYGLKTVAGRNFSTSFATDRHAALINELALPMLGFRNAAEAIGEKIIRDDTLTIIGVVVNYHHQGLKNAIEPMLFILRPDTRNYYSLKISSTDIQRSVAEVQTTWKNFFPRDPFQYFFLDDSFNSQYQADTRFGSVFGLFAFIGILISCFGLLGLSSYSVWQRTKEIGVRKILGASVQQLVLLLSREFLILVLVSQLLAIPVCWWVMHAWLMDFAYRIRMPWPVFVVAGFLAICIAELTVGIQALKASVANPVNSLRTE
jgi:putative ABC transport system permease protein